MNADQILGRNSDMAFQMTQELFQKTSYPVKGKMGRQDLRPPFYFEIHRQMGGADLRFWKGGGIWAGFEIDGRLTHIGSFSCCRLLCRNHLLISNYEFLLIFEFLKSQE